MFTRSLLCHSSKRVYRFVTYPLLLVGLCACLFFTHVERPVRSQTNCQLDCNASVPAAGSVNNGVAFSANSTTSGCASPVTYEWDFGDGTAQISGQSTTHNYSAPGTYTWRMTAHASNGLTTIDTIAGGYGEGVEAIRAPFTTPLAILRDPLERGIFISEQAPEGGLLRFINTGTAAVQLGGKTIEPGTSRVIPQQNDAMSSGYLAVSLAASADGTWFFLNDASQTAILALNLTNQNQTIFNSTVAPGNTLNILSANGPLNGITVHPQTGTIYFTSQSYVYRLVSLGNAERVVGGGLYSQPQDIFPPGPVDPFSVTLLAPTDLVFDPAGNLYIADSGHRRVIKLNTANQLSLIAQFPFSFLNNPRSGNPYPASLAWRAGKLYVANGNQQTIWQLTGDNLTQPLLLAGQANTACVYGTSDCGDGGPLANARFNLPGQDAPLGFAALEADSNGLYVLDQGGNKRGRVRYLNLQAQAVTLAGTTVAPNQIATIAGTGTAEPFDGGPALGALFGEVNGVARDTNGNLWIGDNSRGALRFVNRGSQPVTLFANTPAQQTVLPGQIATVNYAPGPDTTYNGLITQGSFARLQGLFATAQGIYIVDAQGGPSRRFDVPPPTTLGLVRFLNTSPANVTLYPAASAPIIVPPGHIYTVVGGGNETSGSAFALNFQLNCPTDLQINSVTGELVLIDRLSNFTASTALRHVNLQTGVLQTGPVLNATGLGMDASGRLFATTPNNLQRETAPGSRSFVSLASLKGHDVVVDANGDAIVSSNRVGTIYSDPKILRVSPAGVVTTIAGTTVGFAGDGGPALSARLWTNPTALLPQVGYPIPATANIILGADGEIIFADSGNRRIRRIGAGQVLCFKTGTISISGNAPTPVLSQLGPNSAYIGYPFTLVVTGTGFMPGSKVRLNGNERATTFISASQLSAVIPTSDLGIAGTAAITVLNPTPGGGTSNSLTLTISSVTPQPFLNELDPVRVTVGSSFRLNVLGENFRADSVIRWNGQPRQTIYVSSTQLQTDILSTDVSSASFARVDVYTPAPGGGYSNPQMFQIGCPTVAFEPATLPRATYGKAYTATIAPMTAVSSYTITLVSGSLPTGITLQPNGTLSGTSFTGGLFSFRVRLDDAFGCSSTKDYTLGVVVCPNLDITPTSLAAAIPGAAYSQTFVPVNGTPPYSFSFVGGNVPPGFSFSPNGTLSGTASTGIFSFGIRCVDALGCEVSRSYILFVACPATAIYPPALDEALKGVPYSVNLTLPAQGYSPTFQQINGQIPPGLVLTSDGQLSGTPVVAGVYNFTVRGDIGGCLYYREYGFIVHDFSVRLLNSITCLESGSRLAAEITFTRLSLFDGLRKLDMIMLPEWTVVPESCSTNYGNCIVDSAGAAHWTGLVPFQQTLTLRFLIQSNYLNSANSSPCLTINTSGSILLPYSIPICVSNLCKLPGPGQSYTAASASSGQKAGAVLVYNLYTSSASNPNQQNTRITLTNTDLTRAAYVHLFFVDGASCSIADSIVCLTPNQTATFLASDIDPGTSGYLIAVAIDRNGCPISFNHLIGEEYVKLSSGHAANLGAEAIAAIPNNSPLCNDTTPTAELRFDGVMYNALPRVLALSNLASTADGNSTLLVVNRIGGNLSTGASALSGVFGNLYDDAEQPFSFSFSPGTCQVRSILSNSFPRTTPRLETIIPAGRSGWLKFGMQTDGAILGAAINYNANAGAAANAFNQGHNLHKLTLTTGGSVIIPIFPPAC